MLGETALIITKEYSTVGKRQDQKENEDGLLIRDEFVAVIDGVTSKGSKIQGFRA